MSRIMLIVVAVLQVTLLGCAPDRDQARRVTVLAAASLNDVLEEMADAFGKDDSAALTISTGASGALCAQIELGAPCDVFLPADPALVDRLEAAGRIASNSRRVLAGNRLVIAVAAPAVAADGWPELLASAGVSRIALADPDAAPAGRYAREALVHLGLWDRLQAKLVRAADVRSAARLLAMRAVDAAIVYETDVSATDNIVSAYRFAADMHAPIEYVGALIESRDTAAGPYRAAAARFLAFLQSEPAERIWRKHGFVALVAQTKVDVP